MVCEVSRLSRSVKEFCGMLETIQQKHLRLMILGSITVDCREGQMDPMSTAFLSDGVHLQSAGTVPYKVARAVWRRQRQGQGEADRPEVTGDGSFGLLPNRRRTVFTSYGRVKQNRPG
ncbi:MAG: hypothetical protein IJH25_04090 [Clostridia bacterium]|nr:hypothetical protein [Clostridia bacterium]MBQ6120752.1 hypothetical protein [Clostridia bacterium]